MCLRQRPTQGYSLDSHHGVHVCRKPTLQMSSIPKKSGILWVAHDRQRHPSIQGSNSPKHSWDIIEAQSLLSASDPSRNFLPSHTGQLQAQVSITHPYSTSKEWVLLQLFQFHHTSSQCGSAIGVANWLDLDDMLVKGGKCWWSCRTRRGEYSLDNLGAAVCGQQTPHTQKHQTSTPIQLLQLITEMKTENCAKVPPPQKKYPWVYFRGTPPGGFLKTRQAEKCWISMATSTLPHLFLCPPLTCQWPYTGVILNSLLLPPPLDLFQSPKYLSPATTSSFQRNWFQLNSRISVRSPSDHIL